MLVYVDNIVVATNNEIEKCNLFKEFDEAYGIKDQGLLKAYIGVEIEQTDGSITIHQSKYAREILETFGYENAHAVGNPIEINVRLVPLDDGEQSDTSFDYRKEAAMEVFAASNLLQEILPKKNVELKLGIDNQAAHVLATNPTYSRRTRHIKLRWPFVREQVEKGVLDLHKVRGADNPADGFTKPLDKQRLKRLLMDVGMADANYTFPNPSP
ncbi:unnamed protein product [Phytophthora fragariaefolia]|uniref:Unnamed protein product n=1 Tax=Phytophthora fragariaefolia TaxID=1490495 RepID=A0A9W6XRZ6_9STRA|nr:unnamed protein product [Phytophthora fragariaefolia]